MTKQERIDGFKNLGFGIFVHFGVYSVRERGEWYKFLHKVPYEAYDRAAPLFVPKQDWADELVIAAKNAGAKYIVLTSRHHDGFSLYDTCGLSDYDAPHYCGRDLIREYVDACNAHGIIPFLYHTTLDWRHPDFFEGDFSKYLEYLRASVEVLCKNYGKIGGLWFDGNWGKQGADFEEDKLYGLIRKYQPDCIIVNNTGLSERGKTGHPEIDSVTFERGRPDGIFENLGAEMCEVVANSWGYANDDIDFKSMRDLLTSFTTCRRYGANFLLNVGPRGDGTLTHIDKAVLESFGKWFFRNAEAVDKTRPCGLDAGENRFVLSRGDGKYYLFDGGASTDGDANVVVGNEGERKIMLSGLRKKPSHVSWLDNGEELGFEFSDGVLRVVCTNFDYPTNLIWRVAKIEM